MHIRYLLIATLLLSAQTHAGEFYKWVDEKGVVHFSERPPKQADVEKIKTTARTPSAEEKQEAEAAQSSEMAPTTEVNNDPTRCNGEKARLQKLLSGSRIRMSDGNGGFKYLDKAQIDGEIEKSRQAIKEACRE